MHICWCIHVLAFLTNDVTSQSLRNLGHLPIFTYQTGLLAASVCQPHFPRRARTAYSCLIFAFGGGHGEGLSPSRLPAQTGSGRAGGRARREHAAKRLQSGCKPAAVPRRILRPALALRGQWRPGAVRRRPIGVVPAGSPAKWRRRRRRGGCGAAVAFAMPGSRRREPCPRLTALRGRSGGEDRLGRRRRPAECPAEEEAAGGGEEGGAGRGLPAREAPRPSPSREAAVRGAAGTAGAAPALPARVRGEGAAGVRRAASCGGQSP